MKAVLLVIAAVCLAAYVPSVYSRRYRDVIATCSNLRNFNETFIPACVSEEASMRWPNYEDATTFFVCQNGAPVLSTCPTGQFFTYVMQQCTTCANYIAPPECENLRTINPPKCVPIDSSAPSTPGTNTPATPSTPSTPSGPTLPTPLYPSTTPAPSTTTTTKAPATTTTPAPATTTTPAPATTTTPAPATTTTPAPATTTTPAPTTTTTEAFGPPVISTNDPNVPAPPTPAPTPPSIPDSPPVAA